MGTIRALNDSPPRLGALHLLILLPVLGPIITSVLAGTRPGDRAELVTAANWQWLATGVVGVHAVLQGGIELVRWMHASLPPEYTASRPIYEIFGPVLLLLTLLNVLAGLVEWGALVVFAVRASRGTHYPVRAKNRS